MINKLYAIFTTVLCLIGHENVFGQNETALPGRSIFFTLHEFLSLDSTTHKDVIDSLYLGLGKMQFPNNIAMEIIKKDNPALYRYISSNKVLQNKYDQEYNFHIEKFKHGTGFNKLIDDCYTIDQTARIKYKKIIKEFFPKVSITLGVIDTGNYVLLSDSFYKNPYLLADSNTGLERSQHLWILFLHQGRMLSEEEFQKFDALLLDLVKKKLFNPSYYACIYDERLRTLNDVKYPVYNELRNEKLADPDRIIMINKKRAEIGLGKMSEKK